MSGIWTLTSVAEAGVSESGPVAEAVTLRANIMEMTQAAEEAVLAPADCGAWPADLRAALAARIARLNGEEQVAQRYAARQQGQEYAALADPSEDGTSLGLLSVVSFMDAVASTPRDIAAEDISALLTAGIADADIVRLCELNAFLAYQLRLIAGLRLMTEAAA
ncbi:hypothetical protein [Salipiger marinus]|jgi:uncharacterized protein YciW|uniref:N-terminal domain of uncharacterized protein YciW-containing protein n=1 Tax=Salipiger marinus TaxID=555512 RepID=A0A1G8RV22_9RHOB|nr:hypothetical protein [Salipiger marinus]SDJ20190.1 N-terminal domain of uncharacterized protein YciW-containing protein [Salipiger marinus]